MPIARKGSRSITVNDDRYRYRGYAQDALNRGLAEVIVEAWDEPGQRLVSRFDPWVLFGQDERYSGRGEPFLSKRLVRIVIVEGLRRGWRPRERGPQLELTEAQLYGEHRTSSWVERAGVPRQLLEAIIAAPEHDGPRLVLADWLIERGDPRGELISLQCNDVDDARHKELLGRYWRRWSAPAYRVARRWRFERGFVDAIVCRSLPDRQAWEALHRIEPVRSIELHMGDDRPLPWLLQPTTRQLSIFGLDARPLASASLRQSPYYDRIEIIPWTRWRDVY